MRESNTPDLDAVRPTSHTNCPRSGQRRRESFFRGQLAGESHVVVWGPTRRGLAWPPFIQVFLQHGVELLKHLRAHRLRCSLYVQV